MTIQPKFHWQFRDKSGATTVDSISKVQAKLSDAKLSGHGRIGRAIHLLKKDAHVNLGKAVGQFGTGDFTIAFGMKNISNHGDKELDIIGSQTMKGHGNFFSVRLSDRRIFFHVDENNKAKHYVKVQTDQLSMVSNRTWFHVAVVRQGPTLQIYIDGVLSETAESKTGVANIKNNTDVKLGHSRRGTPNAQYEDLRIYDRALDSAEIQALIPPINRPLRHGEIELVATDGAAMILRTDVGHLTHFSQEFQRLRVGPDTAVALFNKASFEGTSQLLYADLPDIKLSRLKDFPASVSIRSAIGNPFAGKWLIKAPNGQFLSLINFPAFIRKKKGLNAMLITSPKRSFNELFKLEQQSKQSRTQLVHDANKAFSLFSVAPKTEATPLFVEEIQPLTGEFAITNQANNQWLEMGEKNTFRWTNQKEKRAVFARVAKMADRENQVGELAPGEVALYEHVAYHGRTWILSDTEKDLSGAYPTLSAFESLQDKTSSIRLGPKTGVTVFRDNEFRGSADEASLIEDIVDNVPNLFDSQIGNDTISSIKIFRTIDPTEIFTSYTSKLSQDYRMVGDKLEEFSAYRTTLRLEPNAGEIEVSATDQTQIEVDGVTHEINEQQTVKIKPNAINRIMITSEADGIDTPGLKFRTQSMAPNEQVVIFPNQEVHRQIAELEDGALWNATDTQGNLIVDHKAHSKEEVASVQNTIKRMMGTVTYADKASPVSTRSVTKSARNSVAATQSVSGATIEDNPWELNLGKGTPSNPVIARKSGVAFVQAKSLTSSAATSGIESKAISQGEFARLLSQSTSSEEAAPPKPSKGFGTTNAVGKRGLVSSISKGFKQTFKKAKSVVVGAVKGVVHVLLKTAEGVFDFVVDTVKQVAEFVESVIETVVKAVKKFIEFLQFLFNWDDILDTQRYLVNTINAGFDYAEHLAEASKKPVSDFVDSLQETVKDSINTLVTSLGGDPSPVKQSEFELPEAAEWFFSKLLGGSKETEASPTPNLVPDVISNASPLTGFTSTLFEGLEETIGLFLLAIEGVGETVASLLANPRQPQLALIILLETLRDIIIGFLGVVEKFALEFLDVLGDAIAQVQNLLNAEVNIPFISSLFKLIGAGPLTPLNVGALLLAIPVTVTYKLVFNEKPTFEVLPSEFTAPVAENSTAVETQAPLKRSVVQQSAQNGSEREGSIRFWGTVSIFSDFLNGLINAGLNSVPEGVDNGAPTGLLETFSLVLSGCSWLGSFPSSPEFPGGRPYNLLAHKVSKTNNPQEYWERVMWSWRTAVFGLDIVVMIASASFPDTLSKIPLFEINFVQRMRRQNPPTIVLSSLLSLIDLGLTSKYLSTIPKDDNPGIEATNEIVSWLPSFLSFLRLSGEPTAALTLSGIDLIATGLSTILSSVMLADDVASLKEAG